MATNALLIEFGAEGAMGEETQQTIEKILGQLNGLKGSKQIEEYRFYPIVTGNRSQRVAMILLEVSHEQLEKLVAQKDWVALLETISSACTNVTVNRAITLERMLELSKSME
jgi:hypothetical protein